MLALHGAGAGFFCKVFEETVTKDRKAINGFSPNRRFRYLASSSLPCLVGFTLAR